MLEKNKQIYTKVADLIPDWRKESRADLLNHFIEYEHTDKKKADSYMAAIICTYWNSISKYYSQCKNSFDTEDYHDWLTHAVLYAVEHRAWQDKNKSIYNKKDAANMVVNQCISSTKHQNYQKSNYQKYKDGFRNLSIEELQENDGDKVLSSASYEYDNNQEEFKNWCSAIVKDSFDKNLFVKAFILDNICNGDTFIRKPGVKTKAEYPEGVNTKYKPKYHYGPSSSKFSRSRLFTCIRNIDSAYCEEFSKLFNISREQVKIAYLNVSKMSDDELKTDILNSFRKLKVDVIKYAQDKKAKELAM